MQRQQRNIKITLAGFLITFAGAILFSTKAIIVKKAFANFRADALTLLTLRMVFSLPFYLVAAFFVSSRKDNVRLTTTQWWMVIFLGLFGYYLSSLLDFIGLQYVSAGLERLILFLFPTFAVLINALIFGQKITRTQIVALLLTYTGMIIAYFAELRFDHNNNNFLLGTFLIFLCAVTYAVYIVGSGRIIPVI